MAFETLYERGKILGRGASGIAFIVKPTREPHQEYVAKEFHFFGPVDKQRREALSEAQLLKGLSHPNIIKCIDIFQSEDLMHIVMEYANGGDLSDHIQRRKALNTCFSESTVMLVFVQLCVALHHIHNRKILHRDLKPANVFLAGDGELESCTVKLGDFGIAKTVDFTMGQVHSTVGTPSYLSPEVCMNKPYGIKSDMWSLGVILYELACLEPPFHAGSLPAMAMKICASEPKPLPEGFSACPQDLVMSLLTKDPTNRPQIAVVLRQMCAQGLVPEAMCPETKNVLHDDSRSSSTLMIAPTGAGSYPSENNISGEASQDRGRGKSGVPRMPSKGKSGVPRLSSDVHVVNGQSRGDCPSDRSCTQPEHGCKRRLASLGSKRESRSERRGELVKNADRQDCGVRSHSRDRSDRSQHVSMTIIDDRRGADCLLTSAAQEHNGKKVNVDSACNQFDQRRENSLSSNSAVFSRSDSNDHQPYPVECATQSLLDAVKGENKLLDSGTSFEHDQGSSIHSDAFVSASSASPSAAEDLLSPVNFFGQTSRTQASAGARSRVDAEPAKTMYRTQSKPGSRSSGRPPLLVRHESIDTGDVLRERSSTRIPEAPSFSIGEEFTGVRVSRRADAAGRFSSIERRASSTSSRLPNLAATEQVRLPRLEPVARSRSADAVIRPQKYW